MLKRYFSFFFFLVCIFILLSACRAKSVTTDEQKMRDDSTFRANEHRKQINEQIATLFGSGNDSERQGMPMIGYGAREYLPRKTVNPVFELDGRSLNGELILLMDVSKETGTIVVAILVNPKGEVLEAFIEEGTSMMNEKTKEKALQVAKQMLFNEVSGTTNQKGTITYDFNYK